MDIDRRSFLTGGLACAGLAVLPGKHPVADFNSADDLAAIFGLHPFTVSLLERVAGAPSAVDRSKVERFIRQRARYLGHRLPPVIKWLPGPQAAFDHLSRHGLTNLLQMENAAFWRQSGCPEMNEEILDRWCAISRLANDVLRPDEHDRGLMAPKLVAKRNPSANPDAAFEVRVFAAQIGWLETSIPDAPSKHCAGSRSCCPRVFPKPPSPFIISWRSSRRTSTACWPRGKRLLSWSACLGTQRSPAQDPNELYEHQLLAVAVTEDASSVCLTRATDFSRTKSPRHVSSSSTSWWRSPLPPLTIPRSRIKQ